MKAAQAEDIAELIPDGATLMIGGFMGAGTPQRLIDELVRRGRRNLTVIANDTARPGVGIGKLIDARLVRRIITSHIGTNPETQRQMIAGEIQVELVPQGTLVERIRAWWVWPGRRTDADRCGHAGGGRQANHRDRRAQLSPRVAADGRLRADQRPARRLPRQSRIRADLAQLQSGHGHGGKHRDRRGGVTWCRSVSYHPIPS